MIIDALLETDYFKKKMLVSLKSDNRLNTVNKLIKQANLHAFLPRPASVYMDFKVSSILSIINTQSTLLCILQVLWGK